MKCGIETLSYCLKGDIKVIYNFSYTWGRGIRVILKPVTVSTDKGLQLSHSPMVGCNSLYGSNFDFRMTYFENL